MAGWGRSSTDPRNTGDLYKTGVENSVLQELKVARIANHQCTGLYASAATSEFKTFNASQPYSICAVGKSGDCVTVNKKNINLWQLNLVFPRIK